MTTQRDHAAEKARQRLARDAAAYRQAVERLDAARAKLTEAVRLADKLGIRQVDILRATGNVWTREHVRLLTREETS